MIISLKFYTFSISDNFLEDILNQRPISDPIKWGNFDRSWSNFSRISKLPQV